jgi:hypothetical protein
MQLSRSTPLALRIPASFGFPRLEARDMDVKLVKPLTRQPDEPAEAWS